MIDIKVIVPGYNCEPWIHKTINSIKNQTFTNFKCIVIDDTSTDNTFKAAEQTINGDNRFKLVRNTENNGALKNIYDGIKIISEDDEDVIITVDGDDWVYDENVFEKVSATYLDNNCLITYGSFIEYPSNITHPYYLTSYDENVIQNNLFRDTGWKASHLRTFKAKLWNSIKYEDFIDPETGKFYETAWDLAFMIPMLEMAGDRSKHIDDILYVYNKENPASDMYIKTQLQLSTADKIRKKPRYILRSFFEEVI